MSPLKDFAVIVGVLLLFPIIIWPALDWWLRKNGWWPGQNKADDGPIEVRDDDLPPEGWDE